MTVKLNKSILLSSSFFILVIAGTKVFADYGIDMISETLACMLLLIYLCVSSYKSRRTKNYKLFGIHILVLVCFSIGIMLQNVTNIRKVILLFTMLVLWASIFVSKNTLNSFATVRKISYSIFYGVLVSICLTCFINPQYMIDSAGDFLRLGFGISAGIRYKNYFGADMLAVFIGIYLYGKYEKKQKIDKIVSFISVFFILLSSSKGAYILFLIFIIVINIDKFRKIRKEQRRALLLLMVFICVVIGVYVFKEYMLDSTTYMLRINGLLNYISHFKNDLFHVIFGNAENIYDQPQSYVLTVRMLTGWNGSLEFSWLDILIKNGVLGIIGFALVFYYYIRNAIKEKNWRRKAVIYALLSVLIISSLVETYIQSVHSIFGLYLYFILSGFISSNLLEGSFDMNNKNRIIRYCFHN